MLCRSIIALLAGSAVYMMSGNVNFAQETKVKTDLQSISTQLKLYQAENGFFPTTEQGIKALVTRADSEPKPKQWRQYLTSLPRDAWQSEYVYVCPGKHNPNSFDL